MVRKILLWLCVCGIIAGLIFLGLDSPQGVQIHILGYDIQTSLYVVIAASMVVFLSLRILFSVVLGIQDRLVRFYNWITGQNKEQAETAFMQGLLMACVGKYITAEKHFKKAEKYFKQKNPYFNSAKYVVASHLPQHTNLYPLGDASLETVVPALKGYFLWQNVQTIADSVGDDERLKAFEKADIVSENLGSLKCYLAMALKLGNREKAEKSLKDARSLMNDTGYKPFYFAGQLALAVQAFECKKPEQALHDTQNALKIFPESTIAGAFLVHSYKSLLKDSKALRYLDEQFTKAPHFLAVVLFLDLRIEETPESLGKRIADLPRQHQQTEPFLALQAYHFAYAHDIHALQHIVRVGTAFQESAWYQAVTLCLQTKQYPEIYQKIVAILRLCLQEQAMIALRAEIGLYDILYQQQFDKMISKMRLPHNVMAGQLIAYLKDFLQHIDMAGKQQQSSLLASPPDIHYLEEEE